MGIDRCKRRARQVMYWPNMSRDIELMVRRCASCQECSNAPPKEPLLPIAIPKLPWEKVGADIFEIRKKYFLVLVDYYSNYVEVCSLPNISSNIVITNVKEIFARHGIPETFITDNGTQFSSREFKVFTKNWDFNHVTSSPNYAQANGKSERAVQTVKSMLKKSILSDGDFYLALLNYRNTPRDGLSSPAQLLMSRRLRCKLPVHPELLKPQPVDSSEHDTMLLNQHKAKVRYDIHCKELPPLNIGDDVVCVEGKARTRATVVGKAATPRSYIVQNKVGGKFRRNRRHLIKCMVSDEPESSKSEPLQPSADCGDEFKDACEDVGHLGTCENQPYDNAHRAGNQQAHASDGPTIIMTRRKAKLLAENQFKTENM
ncbi:uncharacterized protein K02A2.6-like [Cydia pomonella]|uniref:uncharacterized protein K02A2.6-like n=1 Tax=Cydia pomonella TaxID=82600 RepID=UPI002ADD379F|nr:uncharacterized protein K02A2.6-like [Cydia pomonella]